MLVFACAMREKEKQNVLLDIQANGMGPMGAVSFVFTTLCPVSGAGPAKC